MTVLTYFLAELTCPVCGTVSPETTATSMSSKLLDTEYQAELRVGDSPEMSLIDIESAFLKLRDPTPGERIKILQDWTCPTCWSINWALVSIDGRTIRSIDTIAFTRHALDSTHFISERIYDYYQELTGEPLLQDGEVRPDMFELLRSKLPDDESKSKP